jgi:hypothetical protein
MAGTRKQPKTYNGFAIPLQPDTPLGLAMLIAEDEEGCYAPVAVASTISEARELAASDMHGRMHRLERGEDAGLCPWRYIVWAQGVGGDYRIAIEIPQQDVA